MEDVINHIVGNLEKHCQQLAASFGRLKQQHDVSMDVTSTPIDDFMGNGIDNKLILNRDRQRKGWKQKIGQTVTREEVGRATWTFLHTLAAQYPERPSFRQKQDAKKMIDILTRMYPCGECARHFKEVVKAHPPRVESRQQFSLWMCRVHNVVNRSLGKPSFNCEYVMSRWEGIECDTEGDSCSLH
eukprot:jgi/Picsp_1/5465/NSC_02824-R1_protein